MTIRKADLARQVAARILKHAPPELNDAGVANALGISAAAVSGYRRGEFGAGLEVVVRANRAFSLAFRYMLTGKGPVYETRESEAVATLDRIRALLNGQR